MQTELRATLLVALSAILYGSLGYFGIELLNEHLSIATMLFWRFSLASLCILCTTAKLQRTEMVRVLKISLGWKILILGSLSYCIGSSLYFLACQELGTGIAMVVFFCYPLFIALYELLINKQPITKHAVLCLLAIFIGMFLLKGDNQHGSASIKGFLYAIIAALAYALYILGSKRVSKQIAASTSTLLICLGSAVGYFTVAAYNNSFQFPGSSKVWVFSFAIGIIATALPVLLLFQGLKVIHPIKAAVLSALEPIVTVILGLIFLNEILTTSQASGIFIILFAAIFIQFEKHSITNEF